MVDTGDLKSPPRKRVQVRLLFRAILSIKYGAHSYRLASDFYVFSSSVSLFRSFLTLPQIF